MIRRLLVVAAVCLATRGARADISFEPETPLSSPNTPAPPPPPPPKPSLLDGWKPPVIDFRFVNRFYSDTAFDWSGENVAEWYRFLTASVSTQKGAFRVLLTARLRWTSYEEAPSKGAYNFFNGSRPHSEIEPSLGETSISYTRWGIDFSAGMLDIVWGQNAAFSPADVLTPVDLRDGPLTTQDTRMPVPAVRVRGKLGPISWDAVWLPVFFASKLPLLGNDWTAYAAATQPIIPDLQGLFDSSTFSSLEAGLPATKLPQMDFSEPQGGIRLSAHPGPFAVALTWADFFDRQPLVTTSLNFRNLESALLTQNELGAAMAAQAVAADLAAGKAPLSATYVRAMVFAGDAAVSTGPVRWTLDVGYSPERVFPLADLTSTQKPMFSGAAGLEWEGPPVIAAGVYTLLAFDVHAGERLLYLEPANTSISKARNVSFSAGYLAVNERLLDDRLELGLTGLVTFHGDFIATPSAHWHFGDPHSLGVGANVIWGPPGGFGAEYAHNDEVFLEYILHL